MCCPLALTRALSVSLPEVSGNENVETVRVGRDRLGVTGSPAFFLYRNGVLVQKLSGAKEEPLVEAIEKNIAAASPLAMAAS